MSSDTKLGTGYSLNRKQLQEFDLSTLEPRAVGRRRPRISLIDAAGLAHQAQDIGFGISQVLPVVVAAQDATASVVCIEQPELHIHPSVQVGLGDLFIDGAVNKGLSFLIETHSEHLILRLLRRVREAAEFNDGIENSKISPKLLAVYFLTRENAIVKVTEIPVNSEGDFDKPWPQGFFDERGTELF
jgi:predicted ATPase